MYTMKIKKGYNSQKERSWVIETNDPEVMELFGTNTLPTPYNLNNSANFVLSKITALNPDRIVFLEE